MKLALISPPEFLPIQAQRGYHMALCQYAIRDIHYTHMYQYLRSKDAFIILDNGIAEGEKVTNKQLVDCMNEIQPDEVVVPDDLRNSETTIALAVEVHKSNIIPARNRIVVPHGANWDEWTHCLQELTMRVEFGTVGVPKYLEGFTGGRIVATSIIMEELGAMCNIHFLGIYGNPLKELNNYLPIKNHIRGIDSGAPVAWAQHNRVIELSDQRYSLEWETADSALAAQNVSILDKAK